MEFEITTVCDDWYFRVEKLTCFLPKAISFSLWSHENHFTTALDDACFCGCLKELNQSRYDCVRSGPKSDSNLEFFNSPLSRVLSPDCCHKSRFYVPSAKGKAHDHARVCLWCSRACRACSWNAVESSTHSPKLRSGRAWDTDLLQQHSDRQIATG